jgi:hypothetical protein
MNRLPKCRITFSRLNLETKTLPNTVDPEHATLQAAETLRAIVALHIGVI